MNEERNELNTPSGSDEPQDCPNCPNQGWYAVVKVVAKYREEWEWKV